MSYWVYVLKSERDGIRYIGSTQDVNKRLIRHNRGECRFTKGHRPWAIAYQEKVRSRKQAIKRERLLKSGAGRKILEDLLHCPVV